MEMGKTSSRQTADAWNVFINTGSVADYLAYCGTKNPPALPRTEGAAGGGDGNRRTDYPGIQPYR
ncbi:MAG: hypothetical protein FWE80_02735 [Oscillospiraceae bacterium]|nr:hypothetical protein [Oscillospiraceae bacterium]